MGAFDALMAGQVKEGCESRSAAGSYAWNADWADGSRADWGTHTASIDWVGLYLWILCRTTADAHLSARPITPRRATLPSSSTRSPTFPSSRWDCTAHVGRGRLAHRRGMPRPWRAWRASGLAVRDSMRRCAWMNGRGRLVADYVVGAQLKWEWQMMDELPMVRCSAEAMCATMIDPSRADLCPHALDLADPGHQARL